MKASEVSIGASIALRAFDRREREGGELHHAVIEPSEMREVLAVLDRRERLRVPGTRLADPKGRRYVVAACGQHAVLGPEGTECPLCEAPPVIPILDALEFDEVER